MQSPRDIRVDVPFYFPLTPDYSVGQSPPTLMRSDQFGHGDMDGCVFQFAQDTAERLRVKRDVLSRWGDQHMGQCDMSKAAESRVCDFIVERLRRDAPGRFSESQLQGQSFDALAMLVPEDMAITCVDTDAEGEVTRDWLAALHVAIPSGWDPAAMLGRSFGQVHRTVQISEAKRFLLDQGKVKPFVAEMLACESPHVRFIWTLQIGDDLNRHPKTRCSPQPLRIDASAHQSNVFFRVERQTITGFADVGASLFTIRTYLYPLAEVIENEQRRALLRQAVIDMPPRVISYKGWSDELVAFVTQL